MAMHRDRNDRIGVDGGIEKYYDKCDDEARQQ